MNEHTCKALVIHCIDFRFRKMLNEYLFSRFENSYDLVSVVGGAKNLQFVLEQVKISNALHAPETIILIQHEDCGAYGGSKAFGDFSNELEAQKAELVKVEALLKEQFSQPIEKLFVRLSGEIMYL